MEKYLPILRVSPFFKGLSDSEIFVRTSLRQCRNDFQETEFYILREGDSTEVMGLVVSGSVLVIQEDLGSSEYSV